MPVITVPPVVPAAVPLEVSADDPLIELAVVAVVLVPAPPLPDDGEPLVVSVPTLVPELEVALVSALAPPEVGVTTAVEGLEVVVPL